MPPPGAHSQVSTIDVAPTVLELAGLDVGPYRDELDGVSLVQYLRGLPVGEDPNLMPAVGGAVRSHLYIEALYHRAVVQAGSGWKYVLVLRCMGRGAERGHRQSDRAVYAVLSDSQRDARNQASYRSLGSRLEYTQSHFFEERTQGSETAFFS